MIWRMMIGLVPVSRSNCQSLQVCPSQHPAHHRRQEGHQDPGRALATGMCLYPVVVILKFS